VPVVDPTIIVYEAHELQIFETFAPILAYGSCALFLGLDDANLTAARDSASKYDFGEWICSPYPGFPDGTKTWIKSHYDGNTYGSHLPHLLKAVELTAGPVLELGCGDSSTPALHKVCAVQGRFLVSIDSDAEWLSRFKHLESDSHRFEHLADPAARDWLNKEWSVVFVDHAPGNTRQPAIERARSRAELVLLHDSEDIGYGMEEDFWKTFKAYKHHRYSRPWTTVASDRREDLW